MMRTSTSILLVLLTTTSTTLACLQLSCKVQQVCAADADAALKAACDILGNTRVGSQSLVGRDGCGWHSAPTFAPADSPNALASCDGSGLGILADGDLAIWRANDDGNIRDSLGQLVYADKYDGKIGPCAVKKTVGC